MASVNHGDTGWETAEFPIVCEPCLGNNPYIRMMKEKFGKECRVCQRPFTVFRWSPGAGKRFKTTIICQTCSKIKNACQSCVLDLQSLLPTHVRDTALGVSDQIPKGLINREYYANNAEEAMKNGAPVSQGQEAAANTIGVIASIGGPENIKLLTSESAPAKSRKELYRHTNVASYKDENEGAKQKIVPYEGKKRHICSFFVRGKCTRGDACPNIHEIPDESETKISRAVEASEKQKTNRAGMKPYIRNGKIIPRRKLIPADENSIKKLLDGPTDKRQSTLFAAPTAPNTVIADVKAAFYKYGPITDITIQTEKSCVFITFQRQEDARMAATTIANGEGGNVIKGQLKIRGEECRLEWAQASQ